MFRFKLLTALLIYLIASPRILAKDPALCTDDARLSLSIAPMTRDATDLLQKDPEPSLVGKVLSLIGISPSDAEKGSFWLDLNKLIRHYSMSKEVHDMIESAFSNITKGFSEKKSIFRGSKAPQKSIRWCYRYVKEAIRLGGLVDPGEGGTREDGLLDGKRAVQADRVLKRAGFIDLMDHPELRAVIKTPFEAPRGAILVYSGGSAGHIEIKVGNAGEGGFISDYYNSNPITGSAKNGRQGNNRRLIGVFVKPLNGQT